MSQFSRNKIWGWFGDQHVFGCCIRCLLYQMEWIVIFLMSLLYIWYSKQPNNDLPTDGIYLAWCHRAVLTHTLTTVPSLFSSTPTANICLCVVGVGVEVEYVLINKVSKSAINLFHPLQQPTVQPQPLFVMSISIY